VHALGIEYRRLKGGSLGKETSTATRSSAQNIGPGYRG